MNDFIEIPGDSGIQFIRVSTISGITQNSGKVRIWTSGDITCFETKLTIEEVITKIKKAPK